jgi:hypothetical protein
MTGYRHDKLQTSQATDKSSYRHDKDGENKKGKFYLKERTEKKRLRLKAKTLKGVFIFALRLWLKPL